MENRAINLLLLHLSTVTHFSWGTQSTSFLNKQTKHKTNNSKYPTLSIVKNKIHKLIWVWLVGLKIQLISENNLFFEVSENSFKECSTDDVDIT